MLLIRRLVVVFTLVSSNLCLMAFDDPVVPVDTRSSAIGGRHSALTDGIAAIHNNPAGLQGLDRRLQYAEQTIVASGPIFDITTLALRGIDTAALAEPDVQALISGLYAALNLTGPLSFAYVGGGLGFAAVNWIDVSFASVTPTDLQVIVTENYLVTGGYSFRLPLPETFPGTIDVGGMLKTTIQGDFRTTKAILDVVDLFGNPTALLDEPFGLTLGVGIDLGILYRLGEYLSIGLVGHDVFTPTRRSEYADFADFSNSGTPASSAGLVAPDLAVGFMYSPRIAAFERYVDKWKFLLDYNDILDFVTDPVTSRNIVLHIGLGVEAVMLEILSLRVGFNEGLPSAGIGLDLSFIQLDAAVFGSELSGEPGLRPVYNLMFGLKFLGRGGSDRD